MCGIFVCLCVVDLEWQRGVAESEIYPTWRTSGDHCMAVVVVKGLKLAFHGFLAESCWSFGLCVGVLVPAGVLAVFGLYYNHMFNYEYA